MHEVSARSRRQDEATAEHLNAEARKELEHEALRLRRELHEQAAGEIAGTAGTLIAAPERAEARERLAAKFIDWLEETMSISRGDALSLREFYLRPPNAQKNKKLLEAMAHG